MEYWEVAEVFSVKTPKDKRTARTVELAKLYVRLELMTGLRGTDILRLRLPDLREDGIHVQPQKTKDSTGMRLIIEWDAAGELKDLVEEIKRMPPRRVGDMPLFVTRENCQRRRGFVPVRRSKSVPSGPPRRGWVGIWREGITGLGVR